MSNKIKHISEIEKLIYLLVFNEYKKLFFTRAEAAQLINRSLKTLDNMKKDGVGPGYQKDETPGGKGAVMYPLQSIVEFKYSDDYKTA